jgi:hypothetical protein
MGFSRLVAMATSCLFISGMRRPMIITSTEHMDQFQPHAPAFMLGVTSLVAPISGRETQGAKIGTRT